MTTTRTKGLYYAYPSSPFSEQHGHAKTGCWVIEDGSGLPPMTWEHRDKAKAYSFFNEMQGDTLRGSFVGEDAEDGQPRYLDQCGQVMPLSAAGLSLNQPTKGN